MKRLTQNEIDKKIQAHRLWMQDAGGDRADSFDYKDPPYSTLPSSLLATLIL